MKKIISVVLCFSFIISLCACGSEKAETVSAAPEKSESSMCIAMNPSITYSDGEKSNCFEDVYGCMEQDYTDKSYTLFENTNWHWVYYDGKDQVWNEKRADSVSVWQNCKLENKKDIPYAYSYPENGTAFVTPYDLSSVNVLPYVMDTAPKTGLILSVSGKNDEGICYTAPKDGNITVSDLQKGQISAIRKIEGVQTYSLDNDNVDRAAKVIVYLNGNALWAAELGNPNHYLSTKEADGIYTVPFPELKNIKVTKGDVISIVVVNETDFRECEDFIPKQSGKFAEASKICDDGTLRYVSAGDFAYLLNGIQIRTDRARDRFSAFTKEECDEYIEPYFMQSAKLGYKTVIFPVRWKDIEVKKDKYSFEFLKICYEYCKKYDLKVQLLWFGSDVCGFHSAVAKYITEDQSTYQRLKNYPGVLNYGDMDLVEREVKVFNKLLEFLAEYDKDCRTVAIQIENEPNAVAYEGPKLDNYTDNDKIDETTWVAGQKKEIYALMNTLGMCVKNGPYRCVTRVNFMTYQCYYNGLKNGQVKEMCDLEGIDMVGFDSYSYDVSTSLMNVLNFEGNISHFPEYGANHSNMIPQTLLTLSQRSGVFMYQLKVVDEDTAGAIFADLDNVWNLPHGEANTKPVLGVDGNTLKDVHITSYKVDATELYAMNTALNKAGEKIALNVPEKTKVFNTVRSTGCNESAAIGNISVSFANNGGANFGGCGYVSFVSDKELIVFATRGNSVFSFGGCTVKSVSAGCYDGKEWKSEKEIGASNKLSISAQDADNGTLYRVVLE